MAPASSSCVVCLRLHAGLLILALQLALVLLCRAAVHSPSKPAAAAVPVAPGVPPVRQRAAAECRVQIAGGAVQGQLPAGRIQQANINCTGSRVIMAQHEALDYVIHTGVTWDLACAMPGCLLTICGDTSVAFVRSSITGVQGQSGEPPNSTELLLSSASIIRVLCVRDAAHVLLRESIIAGNRASALVVDDQAQVLLSESGLLGNSGFFDAGGLTARGQGVVTITDGSSVSDNARLSRVPARDAPGAGVRVLDRARVVIDGHSTVAANACQLCCGGGAAVDGRGELIVTDATVFADNRAFQSGGAICVRGHGTLWAGGQSVFVNNSALNGGGITVVDFGSAVVNESVVVANNTSVAKEDDGLAGGGGAFAVSDNASLLLSGPVSIAGNRVVYGPGGGLVVTRTSSLRVIDGVRFADNFVRPGFLGKHIHTQENAQLSIGPGVEQEDGPLTKCSSTVFLGRTPCGAGEYAASGLCQCCPSYTFNFEPNSSTCFSCPSNAVCTGGDQVTPVAGYFQSTAKSVQMHKCPRFTSACGEQGMCRTGYTGNLCGACAEGYGLTLPLRCAKCMHPKHQLLLYILMFSACVLLIMYTVHLTWVDNRAGGTALRPSDIIKVLVQFLQYLVILGNISAPWPEFLHYCFASAAVVFGAASGQSSFDCWLRQYAQSARVPLAIQRQLLYFLTPIAVLLTVMLLFALVYCLRKLCSCCCSRGRASWPSRPQEQHLFSRVRIAVLVVAFYAYPTLVKAALGFFACLTIDVPGKQPYPEFAIRNHTSGYWVTDISQECFAGWHKSWAYGLGIPATLLLCAGVPLAVLGFLLVNRGRAAEPAFREHFGFLYRNYRESKMWWEAVWCLQTVLLTAVAVFHFAIKAYYSLLLLGLVLLVSAAVQLFAQPYTHQRLHKLHLTATCCLFLSSWLALTLFTVEFEAVALVPLHTAVGVVLVLINAGYALSCVYAIVQLAHAKLWVVVVKAAQRLKGCMANTAGSLQRSLAPKSPAGRSASAC